VLVVELGAILRVPERAVVRAPRALGQRVEAVRRDLVGEGGVESSRDIDGGQFGVFVFSVIGQFLAFAFQIGPLGVGLGTDGNIFARRHGHRAGDQSGQAGDENAMPAGVGCGDAQNQAGSGKNAVVRAQDGGTQPAGSLGEVEFGGFHGVRARGDPYT
jgi:hypothetical protein